MADTAGDYYGVLGIPMTATEAELRKAYHKKALTCHPDKTKDPGAVLLFQQITKAYDVLIDPTARKAYDDAIRFKKEREAREKENILKRSVHEQEVDAQRRRFKKELLEREEAARRRRAEEEAAQQELRNAAMGARRTFEESPLGGSPLRGGGESQSMKEGGRGGVLLSEEEKARLCTLRVKWDKKISHYSEDMLHDLFCTFGTVESVIVASRKGNGIVVFREPEAAAAASRAKLGNVNNRLQISFADLSKPPPESPHIVAQSYDYEAATLLRMRQAAERQRLAAEIKQKQVQEDAAAAVASSPPATPTTTTPGDAAPRADPVLQEPKSPPSQPLTAAEAAPPSTTATLADSIMAHEALSDVARAQRRRDEEMRVRQGDGNYASAAGGGSAFACAFAGWQSSTGVPGGDGRLPQKHEREREGDAGPSSIGGEATSSSASRRESAEPVDDDEQDVFLKPSFMRVPATLGQRKKVSNV